MQNITSMGLPFPKATFPFLSIFPVSLPPTEAGRLPDEGSRARRAAAPYIGLELANKLFVVIYTIQWTNDCARASTGAVARV